MCGTILLWPAHIHLPLFFFFYSFSEKMQMNMPLSSFPPLFTLTPLFTFFPPLFAYVMLHLKCNRADLELAASASFSTHFLTRDLSKEGWVLEIAKKARQEQRGASETGVGQQELPPSVSCLSHYSSQFT